MSNFHKDNMSDNEIRILGTDNPNQPMMRPNGNRKVIFYVLAAVVAVALICIAIYSIHGSQNSPTKPGTETDTLSTETIRSKSESGKAYVAVADTTVNDIPLTCLMPTGGHVELFVGKHPEKDDKVILAVHAADVRADIDAPAGAFVYNGELIAKGRSKLGFCAIINGVVSIGRQLETPLFERAIEENGSFFRQYSLVSNGKMIDIPPKGKKVRRALCLKDKQLMVVSSVTEESYHDFSQALVDIGVTEAISLKGSDDVMSWRDKDGKLCHKGEVFANNYKSENFIVWRR